MVSNCEKSVIKSIIYRVVGGTRAWKHNKHQFASMILEVITINDEKLKSWNIYNRDRERPSLFCNSNCSKSTSSFQWWNVIWIILHGIAPTCCRSELWDWTFPPYFLLFRILLDATFCMHINEFASVRFAFVLFSVGFSAFTLILVLYARRFSEEKFPLFRPRLMDVSVFVLWVGCLRVSLAHSLVHIKVINFSFKYVRLVYAQQKTYKWFFNAPNSSCYVLRCQPVHVNATNKRKISSFSIFIFSISHPLYISQRKMYAHGWLTIWLIRSGDFDSILYVWWRIASVICFTRRRPKPRKW